MTKKGCCIIETAFGCDLEFGVQFVGTSSLLVSCATLFAAVTGLIVMVSNEDEQYGRHPIQASNLIVVLVFFPMSLYQIILSALLLWQVFKLNGNVFLCSLWFSSHTTILCVYGLLFIAKAAACIFHSYYVMGFVIIVAGILYEVVFIYFVIIVNSYLNSLDRERYY